jgi:uncharacterized protein YyaL (SSP411 family)
MPNRLASETSPYLLQHQNNPVDWYPWGEEAFAKAKEEDKPVFLSVGYSSCHWCHVMEHESFEDADVAALLNEHFVCVKVDREERPDVDEAYMIAVQLSSGRGGWPMSAFLTPDKKPFFAGTYFPKLDRGQYPGVMTLAKQIASMWRVRRAEVEQTAGQFAEAIRQSLTRGAPGTFDRLTPKLLEDCIRALTSDFDRERAGFGQAPKFPPHSALDFLFLFAMSDDGQDELRESSLMMAMLTLEAMALGGIRDHVGGGFHRYSTDSEWLLPHFEKMLYDNALLLRSYARAMAVAEQSGVAQAQLFADVVQGIVEWLVNEMRLPDGLYASAIDADSEGEEGKFYVWTTDEVRALLGGRADKFLAAYGFSDEGNFEDEATRKRTGVNIPHLAEYTGESFREDLATLRAARATRVRPGLDDKAIVSWNALLISGFLEAGLLGLAEDIALAILAAEELHGSLPHHISRGVPSGSGFLDDYAYLVSALNMLCAAVEMVEAQPEFNKIRGQLRQTSAFWEEQATRLKDVMVDRFYDEENGGFFSTSEDHEVLFGRGKPCFDQPLPSANAVAIQCLAELGEYDEALRSLNSLVGWMQRAPASTEALHATGLLLLALPAEAGHDTEAQAPVAVTPAETGLDPLKSEVSVRLSTRELVADPSGVGRARITLHVPSGLHLNTDSPPARWLTPTKIEAQPVSVSVEYPAGSGDRYEGLVEIPIAVSLPSGSKEAEFELKVSFQACTDRECQLPVEKTFDCVIVKG